MLTLVLIGLLGGLITGISPCILPVLPVVFLAGGGAKRSEPEPVAEAPAMAEGMTASANGGAVAVAVADTPVRKPKRSRRPYAVIAGLVLSFSFFTLLGSILISALGLPDDILRVIGLSLLVLIGLGLIFPKLEELIERPFARLPQRPVNQEGGAFVLGLGLGLLYVPCAGPVLTAITVAGASHRISLNTVALTISFAIGATLPLLLFALAGRHVADRIRAFRTHARTVRRVGGVVMLALAVALAFNVTDVLQRALPGYTDTLQQKVENNSAFRPQLSGLTDAGNTQLSKCADDADQLQQCGPAPAFTNIGQWLNTPGGAPVPIPSLRGKVVLVDFWTYSCINCQRSIPHVEAWSKAYQDAGLQVIGVHTPEFQFEHDAGNVSAAIRRMGITYPVPLDNMTSTFTAYRNQYWPAEYLIDATGQVRHISFGEGHYDQTETLIRQLLSQTNPAVHLPGATDLPDTTPTSSTLSPENYLSYRLVKNYTGTPLVLDKPTAYHFPAAMPANGVSLDGTWTTGESYFQPASGARLALNYNAKNVYLVLAGTGTVTVSDGGVLSTRIPVSGTPNAYPLLTSSQQHTGKLTITFSSGLQAYDFTFG
jgi:cytochrome c biogenesis protein CcdA/thiol-disulfide isomerase/thioredoxin